MANHYETKQAILEDAGLSFRERGEIPTGNVNGTNRVFTVAHNSLSDADYDDDVSVDDVELYFDGVNVPVSLVNPDTGQITATTAPANGVSVTVDYTHSPVLDSVVENLRDEAEDWINETMDSVDSTPYADVPATVRKITRFYAAGMLLLRDYGFQADTSSPSKDGKGKIEMAEKWLDRYFTIGGATGNVSTDTADDADLSAVVRSDDDIFSRIDKTTGRQVSVDDIFMRDPYGDA